MKRIVPHWMRRTFLPRLPLPATMTREELQRSIVDTVAEVTGEAKERIAPTSLLVKDLAVDGDDFSLWLVPEIEWRFQITAPRCDWERIETVAQIIDLVAHRRAMADDS